MYESLHSLTVRSFAACARALNKVEGHLGKLGMIHPESMDGYILHLIIDTGPL